MMGRIGDLHAHGGYPNSPGYSEPTTSKQAAAKVAPRAGTLRDECLRAIRNSPGGMTADEVAGAIGKTEFSVRPRLSELRAAELIRDSGLTRPNASGSNAAVWIATETPHHDHL